MVEYCSWCGARMSDDMFEFNPDWSGFCAECEREMVGSKGLPDKVGTKTATDAPLNPSGLGNAEGEK